MTKYKFTPQYQSMVVAAMLFDPLLLADSRDALRAEYFDGHSEQEIARIVLDFFDTYRNRPGRDTVVQLIHERANRLGWDAKDRDQLLGELSRILSSSVESADMTHLRSEVQTFGRIQALKLSMLESVSLIADSERGENVDLTQVETNVRRALMVGGSRSIGVSVSKVLPDMRTLCQSAILGGPESRVLTGWPTIDKALRGGPGAGEICFVLAPSNRGKSMVLANIAAAGFRSGKRIIYFTFEMKEPEVVSRIAANLTQCDISQVQENDPVYIQKVNQLAPILEYRNMRVIYIKPSDATPNNLRAIIMRIEALEGWLPQEIIVDYLDEMKVEKRSKNDDSMYEAYGNLASELLSIAVDYKCPLWTASQVQREGYEDTGADLKHVGRSMQKIDKAEFVITIIQDDSMKRQNRMVLRAAKNRRGPVGQRIECVVNLSKATIVEKS